MAGEWHDKTLGDLCDFIAGSAFPKRAQGEPRGDYPFIKVSDMNLPSNERFIDVANNWIDETKRQGLRAKLHPVGATVFAKIGIALTYNRRRILRYPTIIDNNMMSAAPRDEVVDSLFFYYLLRTLDFNDVICGTALPFLNISDLQRIPASLPSLHQQRAIAHVLGTLDNKIELNRRMNQTLESIARAIFKSWFVNFDPVRAKAEGRQPSSMDVETAALFPDSFEDSAVGKIPKGWEVGRVGDVFDVTMGQSPPGETYNEIGEGILFFQGIRDFGTRFPAPRVFCTAPSRFAQKGDTLVSVRAPVGEINMALEDCCIGRGLSAVRHKTGFGSYTFYAMSNLREDFARFEAEGTVFGSMSKQKFLDVLVLLPPERLTQRFEDKVAPIDKRTKASHRESTILSIVRDTLLPQLLSGEIRVKDAEKFSEDIP